MIQLLADKVVAMEFAESISSRRCARYSKNRTQTMEEEGMTHRQAPGTPVHGSLLNSVSSTGRAMAETELSVFSNQCLNR